jgi:hypothetical protein
MNQSLKRLILLLAAALIALAPAQAGTVNLILDLPASLADTDVWLYWYINPGPDPYQVVNATLTDLIFGGGGLVAPLTETRSGLVTGALNNPGDPLTFSNDYNSLFPLTPPVAGDYSVLANFNQWMRFTVSMNPVGPPVDPNLSPSGAVFVFQMFTASGDAVAGDGTIGVVGWDPLLGDTFEPVDFDGTTLLRAETVVPEPASVLLFGAGVASLIALRRRALLRP